MVNPTPITWKKAAYCAGNGLVIGGVVSLFSWRVGLAVGFTLFFLQLALGEDV